MQRLNPTPMFDDQPPATDLSRLRIARGAAQQRPQRPRWRRMLVRLHRDRAWIAAMVIYRVAPEPRSRTRRDHLAYCYQAQSTLNATGYVVAQRKASVASKATGRMEWLGVAEGSRVKKGEVIARLESQDVAAARAQAAANITVARANVQQALAEEQDARRQLDRTRELLAQSFVSQAAYDTALARNDKAAAAVNSARAAEQAAGANLRAAEVSVDQTVIRAPFDGVVLTKNADVGDTVSPSCGADTRRRPWSRSRTWGRCRSRRTSRSQYSKSEGRATLRDPSGRAPGRPVQGRCTPSSRPLDRSKGRSWRRSASRNRTSAFSRR